MTGLVLIADLPSDDHLQFQLRLRKSPVKEMLFWDRRGLGNVSLLSDHKEYQEKLTSGKLGLDALAITPIEFVKTFSNKQHEIKVALLDQLAVAGVGNLYASEIFHLAGVHPQARCNHLSKKQYQRIHTQMVEVLELAIEHKGSTLLDGTYRNVLNNLGGYQNQHQVCDCAGEKCPTCQRWPAIFNRSTSQNAVVVLPRDKSNVYPVQTLIFMAGEFFG